MKLRAEVLAVESQGDCILVKLQAVAGGDAEWRPHLALSLELPDRKSVRQGYYVGRIVNLEVKLA